MVFLDCQDLVYVGQLRLTENGKYEQNTHAHRRRLPNAWNLDVENDGRKAKTADNNHLTEGLQS